MTAATTSDRRRRIVKILVDMIENGAYDNDIHYVSASDITDEDPELSGSVVGTHLSDMETTPRSRTVWKSNDIRTRDAVHRCGLFGSGIVRDQ